MTTVCAKCEHFICNGPIWYDQLCGAPATRRPETVNPITGAKEYESRNDLGGVVLDDSPFPNARTINGGACPHYTAKYLRVVDDNNSIIPEVSP